MSVIEISDFIKMVIQTNRKIPAGKIATYGQIAELSGKPPKGSAKRSVPKMSSKGSLILILIPLLGSSFGSNARAQYDAAVSPALIVDSAEVPPTSKSSHSWLASSATVMLASDYIYRGLSQTFGHPTAQGSLDFTHASGFGFGFFGSNINLAKEASAPAQSETDAYLDWNREFEIFKVGAMILSSNYIGQPESDSVEFSSFVGWKILKFDGAYMPKYFGVDSSSTYLRLTSNMLLQPKDSLILAIGRTFFSDEAKVGYRSYSDFKAGINHTADGWGFELDWTGTDRKSFVGAPIADQAVVASLSRTFE